MATFVFYTILCIVLCCVYLNRYFKNIFICIQNLENEPLSLYVIKKNTKSNTFSHVVTRIGFHRNNVCKSLRLWHNRNKKKKKSVHIVRTIAVPENEGIVFFFYKFTTDALDIKYILYENQTSIRFTLHNNLIIYTDDRQTVYFIDWEQQ